MSDTAQTAEEFGEDDPDLCVREVLDMIDEDRIKPDQASALQSALFRRTGRGLGRAISEAFENDPKLRGLGSIFKAPPAPKDYGLEDVSDRNGGTDG